MWEWFVSVREKKHRVSGPVVQEYAKRVAQKLWKTEFKASNGWLESFRKRHHIVFNELCGESSDVNSETIEELVAKVPSIIQGYEPENIGNYINIDKDVQTEPDTMDIGCVSSEF